MKLFKHGLFIIGGFLIIYLLALVAGAYEHQTKLNDEVLKRVIETKSYDEWLSYQTHIFKHVDESISDNLAYRVDFYATVEAQSLDIYKSNIYVFIMPLKAVTYAESVRDSNDLMRFIISNETKTLLDTDEVYASEALSYGLNPIKLGFVYQGVTLDEVSDLNFKVYDYEGNLIIDKTLSSAVLDNLVTDYEASSLGTYIDELGYKRGKTSSEISQIINPRIQRSVFLYVSIYFGALALGYSIFYGIKMLRAIKYNKENKNE